MADPTLKDVLDAIAAVRHDVETHRAETRQQHADTSARFDRVDAKLADLDRDLDQHMKVHAELEKDVAALKGRPLRTATRRPRRKAAR
jgi:hypothetical protein